MKTSDIHPIRKAFRFPHMLLAVLLFMGLFSCKKSSTVEVRGELKKWHKVTLVFNDPHIQIFNIDSFFFSKE